MKIQELLQEIKLAALATLGLLIILCGLYPLVVWGIAQVAFPGQANGSLVKVKGQIVGSGLLAQNFSGAAVLPPAAFGGGRHRLRRHQLRRQQPGAPVPEAQRSGEGAGGEISRRE